MIAVPKTHTWLIDKALKKCSKVSAVSSSSLSLLVSLGLKCPCVMGRRDKSASVLQARLGTGELPGLHVFGKVFVTLSCLKQNRPPLPTCISI